MATITIQRIDTKRGVRVALSDGRKLCFSSVEALKLRVAALTAAAARRADDDAIAMILADVLAADADLKRPELVKDKTYTVADRTAIAEVAARVD